MNSKIANSFLLKEIGFFILVMRKEFMVGYNKQLHILKFVATVGKIYNFEQNSIDIFAVFFKKELWFL